MQVRSIDELLPEHGYHIQPALVLNGQRIERFYVMQEKKPDSPFLNVRCLSERGRDALVRLPLTRLEDRTFVLFDRPVTSMKRRARSR